jgi:hypothetical protein
VLRFPLAVPYSPYEMLREEGLVRLEPVRTYRKPDYPTRIELALHPEILEAIPERWRSHPTTLAVLALLTAVIGCDDAVRQGGARGAPSASGAVEQSLAKVAPIFEHGRGRAFLGGLESPRIVFLTEDEAVRIVVEEAAKAGVSLGGEPSRAPLFTLPAPKPIGSAPRPSRQTDWLRPDGTDSKRNISFEFFSHEDFVAAGVPRLDEYDFKAMANWIRDRILTGASPGYYAVFYDPLPPYEDPPKLPEANFGDTTRAPLTLFQQGGDGRTIDQAGKHLRFEVGSRSVDVDGKKHNMPASAQLRGELLYVPLRFVVDTLGGELTMTPAPRHVTVGIPRFEHSVRSGVYVHDFGGDASPGTVAFTDFDRVASEGRTLEVSQRELRSQVRDFISWLREQGVI